MMVYIYQAPVILISTPYAQPHLLFLFVFLAAQSSLQDRSSQPATKPGPQQGKRRVLTTGLPGNSRRNASSWAPSQSTWPQKGPLKLKSHTPSTSIRVDLFKIMLPHLVWGIITK